MFLGKRLSDAQIEELEKLAREEKDKQKYRRIQCVLLRAKPGKPVSEIAKVIGFHPRHVQRIQADYFKNGARSFETPKHEKSPAQYLSYAEEAALLKTLEHKAEQGHCISRQDIQVVFEEKVGHAVDETTVGRLLKRHGWRKVVPRPQHPRSNPDEQRLFKKTP